MTVILLFATADRTFAATSVLSVPQTMPEPQGRSLTVPVMFTAPAGYTVAALQFDVMFDPAALSPTASEGITEGSAAKKARKQVSFSVLSPGKVRVLVVGINAEVIKDGEIARLNFHLEGAPRSSASAVRIINTVLADPEGSELPLKDNSPTGTEPDPLPDASPGTTLVAWAAAAGCVLAGALGAFFIARRFARRTGAVGKRSKMAVAKRGRHNHA